MRDGIDRPLRCYRCFFCRYNRQTQCFGTKHQHVSPDGKNVCIEDTKEKHLLIEEKAIGKLLIKLENAVQSLWSPNSQFLLHRIPEEGKNRASGTIRIHDLRP